MSNPLFTAITGLSANQTALGVISSNIANSNTIAYKSSTAQFEDLFSQQLAQPTSAAGLPLQVGLGVRVGSVLTSFAQGTIQVTGRGTDAAIIGNGLFVLNGHSGLRYSRAGNFTIDSQGNLVNPNGLRVQGYTGKDANGNVIASGALNDINIPVSVTSPPTPTTTLAVQANLKASALSGTVFNVEARVFDSLGGEHLLTLEFTRAAAGNSWAYQVKVDGNSFAPPKTGTIAFNANGQITTPPPDAAGSPLTTLTIAGQTLANGATLSNIKMTLVDAAGKSNFTGFDAPSATTAAEQNGSSSGVLTGINIAADGAIQGRFSNGQTTVLAQLAVATFDNFEGLTKEGGNLFAATLGSGAANIGAPGTAGRGTIAGNSIESSNVDLSTEFSNLILAQRGFQANSRVITASDQLLQDVVNLIR